MSHLFISHTNTSRLTWNVYYRCKCTRMVYLPKSRSRSSLELLLRKCRHKFLARRAFVRACVGGGYLAVLTCVPIRATRRSRYTKRSILRGLMLFNPFALSFSLFPRCVRPRATWQIARSGLVAEIKTFLEALWNFDTVASAARPHPAVRGECATQIQAFDRLHTRARARADAWPADWMVYAVRQWNWFREKRAIPSLRAVLL